MIGKSKTHLVTHTFVPKSNIVVGQKVIQFALKCIGNINILFNSFKSPQITLVFKSKTKCTISRIG